MLQPTLENRVFLDWFKAHTRDSLRRYLISSSGSASDLLEFLSPFSAPYHSSLNPIFLAECEHLKQLDYASTWLARDGLVPLLWFFSRFPSPLRFQGRIYLPADLVGLAPKEWHPRLGTYRFGELPPSQRPRQFIEHRPRINRLILLGINSPSYCSVEMLDELLCNLRKKFATRFGAPPSEILIYLIQKTEPLGTLDQASRHASETWIELCKKLGTRIKILDFRDFESGLNFNGAAVLDLNEGLLFSDNSLVHIAIGKGAALLDKPLGARGATYARSGLHHGFELLDRIAPLSRSQLRALEKRVETAMASTANHHFPWQLWSQKDTYDQRVRESALTGAERVVEQGSRKLNVALGQMHCYLDSIYLGADKLDIHGWCIDHIHDRAPQEVCVFRGNTRLLGNITRTVRADVQVGLGKKFDEYFKPGFEFQLPRSALKDLRTDEVFSVYCLFGYDLAIQAGKFRLDPRTGAMTRVPTRNRSLGTYSPIQVKTDRLEIFAQGPDARPINYALTEPGGHYQVRLDRTENEEGEIHLEGWAADFLRSAPAEAVVAFDGGPEALIFPVLDRRPDIANALDHLEISGFSLRAPWVKPRVFVLFEPGIAIEVQLPTRGGSA